MENFVAFKTGFFAPGPEVGATKIESVAELDQHVEQHQQAPVPRLARYLTFSLLASVY